MSAYTNSRKQDTVLEQTVAKFMDENFYSKLYADFERVTDSERQIAGIDVLLNGIAIDEKVKIKGGYLNKILDYPSFEISFKSQADGKIVDGWFARKDLKTDYYCFLSVFSSDSEAKMDTLKDIDKVVALFVKKSDVIDFINKYDNFNYVLSVSEHLRSLAWLGEDTKRFPHHKFHLKLSTIYPEQPVNLVIKRSFLQEMPHTREIEVAKEVWNRLPPLLRDC